jgi:apolipoprotein N-acyltransferase
MGMVTVGAWYAAGPLVAVVLLLPPMHLILGRPTGSSAIEYVLWGLLVAAILLWWSVRRAKARAADTHP